MSMHSVMDARANAAIATNGERGVRLASKRTCLAVLASCVAISSWLWPQAQLQVGYALLTADSGSSAPVAAALFTFSNSDGVLVSQAGVAAAEPIPAGRIFVDQEGTETGIALANPSAIDASATLILRDASGNERARNTLSLPAGRHLARFVSELFPGLPGGFTGSLTFESNQRLAAITLRQSQNAQGEPLYATLPVVDLSLPATADSIVFPQIAAGGGYSTQVVLINGTAQTQHGQVALFGSGGNPLSLLLNGNSTSSVAYEISPHGTYRATLERAEQVVSGYAVVSPDPGSTTPSGTAIFQFRRNGGIVTEAGVAASPSTTAARIFVDNAGSFTGVALANQENQPATVSFALLDANGESVATTTRNLAERGHLAVFAHELFPEVPGIQSGFTGLLEITCSTPVAPITLKLTINQRNDLILTTLPVADLNHPLTASSLVFPQIAIGEGFSTRLIFINSKTASAATGRLSFFRSDGSAMTIPFGSQTGSQFSYHLPQGGGKQFFPGNSAGIASIVLLDPSTNLSTREIAVNEGNTVRPRLLVLDTTGTPRDDFDLSYVSIDPEIASIDATGNITGKKAGFSTMTISSGGLITTATINVVSVRIGPAGFNVTGVAQDLARRLYLAATQDHTILLAQELTQRPDVYAGTKGISGLKNDARLKSLFRNPSFLAFDQAKGTLYVSDGANHVIRRVYPGAIDKVDTLAGTGSPGSTDGAASTAAFNNPRGVALDSRGNLWVVDSGNHTIRRIRLATGTVETIAGKAGNAGWADGTGDQARFSAPIGIANETDFVTLPSLLSTTGPPPPISMLVADAGNGVIRRVRETGEVETIRSGAEQSPAIRNKSIRRFAIDAASPLSFVSPTGLAVDQSGNIYVTEPGLGRVRTILQSGEVVAAAQAKTFNAPTGVTISASGKTVVADSASLAREVGYGEPQITSIFPDKWSNRGGETITITGNNFSPETLIVVGGVVVKSAEVRNTSSISFLTPPLNSGLGTLTVQNRGGLAQRAILVEPVPLSALQPGYITTIGGGSTFAGDGLIATSAVLSGPEGLAVDAGGNLFIGDTLHNRVRKVSATTGIITTVAGNGADGFSGDKGPATAASLSQPRGVAVDSAGNVFIADTFNHRIRKVDSQTGIISTVAGDGGSGSSGDGGPASRAQLAWPEGIAVDRAGNLFIAELFGDRIRRVDATTGQISTVAGNGMTDSFSGDGGPATAAALNRPRRVFVDDAGNLFIADTVNSRIRRVDVRSGIITTVAGNRNRVFSGDNGPATSASLNDPWAVTLDPDRNIYIADTSNGRIRKVAAGSETISTVAGNGSQVFSGDGGAATLAGLGAIFDVATDAAGNLFILDSNSNRVRKIDAKTGVINSVAGNGMSDTLGEGGPAIAAYFFSPTSIQADSVGNLYVADTFINRVRRIDARTGIVTTVVGTGTKGFSGDNGLATAAALYFPLGISLDSAGNIYIADTFNSRVRRVSAATRVITTIAGGGVNHGDGGPAGAADLFPTGLAVEKNGNVLIADDNRVRRVDSTTGIITTVAGNGSSGYSGDNGPATLASLEAYRVALDTVGNIYIVGANSRRIRKVEVNTGIITTVAGGGDGIFSGDNGPATMAALNLPTNVAIDAAGNIYIADTGNDRIRRIDGRTGIITTIAGSDTCDELNCFSPDNVPATAAKLSYPEGIALDSAGNLYIGAVLNRRLRAVRGPIR